MTSLELELKANRFDLVSRWADDLAHEVKNPLHAMVINLELVKRRAGSPDPGPIVERTEIVEAELHRVHVLVDSLLRIVRPWPVVGSANVDRVFEELLPVLGARTRIRRVDFEHTPDGGAVAMGPGRLAQVILNLIDNAIDATPEGGRIQTRCENDEEVRIIVVDSGAGIPGTIRDSVTEAGVTSRSDRSGLGLTVTRRLLEEAGGTLVLEAGPAGTGTRATVTLPRPDSA